MLEAGKHKFFNCTVLRWAGLVSCMLYLIVASDVIYAFPVEQAVPAIEAVEVDECADMVCAVQVNDEGKSTCCCNPDGKASQPEPATGLCALRNCSSPQDREGTVGSKTTKPVPQSANAARFFISASPSAPDRYQTALRPPHTDIPDKIPI